MSENQMQWVAILAIGIVAVTAYMKASMNVGIVSPPPPLPNGTLPIQGAPSVKDFVSHPETVPTNPGTETNE